MTDLSKNKILISPIGIDDPPIFNKMGENIYDIFDCHADILHLLDNIEFAFSTERNQYNSTKILEKLTELAPSDYLKVIALCDKDLFIPILTFVFGEAELNGKSCVVSTYRLKDSTGLIDHESMFTDRIIKETVHELGHTFNIRHCPDKACIMHYCRSLNDVDNKDIMMCRYCSTMLEDEMRRMGS